jgi:hypothetical protein
VEILPTESGFTGNEEERARAFLFLIIERKEQRDKGRNRYGYKERRVKDNG